VNFPVISRLVVEYSILTIKISRYYFTPEFKLLENNGMIPFQRPGLVRVSKIFRIAILLIVRNSGELWQLDALSVDDGEVMYSRTGLK
jgi:hypothetical protein